MASLAFHPAAAAEVEDAYNWYAERDPILGAAFLDELHHALATIREAPQTWPSFQGARRYLMRRFPYHVIYRQVANAIQIVAVMHARRRPGYWRNR